MKAKQIIIIVAVLMTSCGLMAAPWFTMPGDTLSTKGGFPWNMPETNYNFKIATHDTAAATYTNAAGTGTGMLGLTYSNFEQWDSVVISGSIAGGSLNLDNNAYLEIGLVTEAMVTESENWYLSGMFNDSVFLTIAPTSLGQYRIKAGDYNLGGGNWSSNIDFDHTVNMAYELTVDFVTDIASLRIDNGAGWTSPVTVGFGISDWAAGYGSHPATSPEDFTSAALIAQLYNEGDETLNSASFGDIAVTPEPATLALLGLGTLLLRKRRM